MIVAIRLFAKTDKEKEELSKKVLIYPYSKRNSPPKDKSPTHPYNQPTLRPRGMEYWKLLAEIINKEPVKERDRFMMAMLKPIRHPEGETLQT